MTCPRKTTRPSIAWRNYPTSQAGKIVLVRGSENESKESQFPTNHVRGNTPSSFSLSQGGDDVNNITVRSTKTILKRRVRKLEQIGDILVFKGTNETAPVSGILRGANWTFSVSEL